MPTRRKVGRPRKRRVVRRRVMNQPGGQLGAIMPLVKFLGPLLLGEAAKFGIQTGLKSIKRKKKRGRGLHPAGAGLKLAGQGHRRGRKPGPKRGSRRNMILPFPSGFKFPILR